MKAFYQLSVCVVLLVHQPDLPSVWLVEQENIPLVIYMNENIYIRQKPVRAL